MRLNSLRTRLMLGYFATIALAILISGNLVLSHMRNTLEAEKAASMLLSANIAANAVEGALSESNRNELRQLSRQLSTSLDSRVLYLDRSGSVLADGFGEMDNRHLTNAVALSSLDGESNTDIIFSDEGSVIYTAVPIFRGGEVVGSSFLSADMDVVLDSVRNARVALLYGALFGGAVAAILAYAFTSTLTTPLRRLAELADRLASGKLDPGTEVPVSSDEVGELGRAFRHMIDSLEREHLVRRMFVDNASHEIRSPLASLRALAQGLLDDPDPDPDLQREFLQQIEVEIDRLEGLARGLTDLSASQMLLSGFVRETTAIHHLADAVRKDLSREAAKKGVHIGVSGEAHWPVEPDWFKVALANLVGNSLKYVPEGIGSITISVESTDEILRVDVEDNGPGIPEDERLNIFDRFYRIDKARDRKSGGSGLGLSIVRQIVSAHGGSVSAVDSPRNGARFLIVIPRES